MEIEEPNDLLRLCYEYKLKQIPISDAGSITGSLSKDDLVSQLSQSEGFDRSIQQLIRSIVEPVEEDFIDRLREKLRNDEVTGIPVVTKAGEVERTITPGVLQAEEDSEEFLDELNELEMYEELLDEFPFPLRIERNGSNVFENSLINSYDVSQSEWDEEVISLADFSVYVYIPTAVREVYDAFRNLGGGEGFDLRNLLDSVERQFLEKAHTLSDSISSAADMVGLPRQTFNYRWQNKSEGTGDDD